MRKKLLFGLVLLIALVSTGCSLKKDEKRPTLVEKVTVTEQDMETFKKVSEAIFNVEKEELKIKDLTPEENGKIAVEFYGYFTDTSGTEMTKNFRKYFGEDLKVEYGDIMCPWDHGSKEENIMLYFDKEKDRYVYNDKHPGHGGGGVEFIGNELAFDSLDIVADEYHYKVKALFYGQAMCHDVGPCDYGKAYKNYSDAKNETNSLTEIDNNSKYVEKDYNDFPITHLDKVIEDYKDKLDTYEFIFVREKNNLVFKEYKKA